MSATNLIDTFGVRPKSNRAKLITYLSKHKGKDVPVADAIRAVYGKRDTSAKRKLGMVVTGLESIIADKKLKMEIRQSNGNIGLFNK